MLRIQRIQSPNGNLNVSQVRQAFVGRLRQFPPEQFPEDFGRIWKQRNTFGNLDNAANPNPSNTQFCEEFVIIVDAYKLLKRCLSLHQDLVNPSRHGHAIVAHVSRCFSTLQKKMFQN